MSEKFRYEQSRPSFSIMRKMFEDKLKAQKAYEGIPLVQKQGMAKVYQDAFGGYPWYERYQCSRCGAYQKDPGNCPSCGDAVTREAYPRDELVKNYFPKMLADYTPGTLILSQAFDGRVVGFSSGGMIPLEALVQKKYAGSPKILASICARAGFDGGEQVFYDNETCIAPEVQNKGVGRRLSAERIKSALELDAGRICGRTINMPWLKLKEEQLKAAGYSFDAFVPEGESYSVDDVMRTFYMAVK